MDSIIKADIFFLVSTIALIVISIGIVVALIYLIRILRTVSHVSEKVKEESGEVLRDIRELRHSVKQEGIRFRDIFGFITGFIKKRSRRNSNK